MEKGKRQTVVTGIEAWNMDFQIFSIVTDENDVTSLSIFFIFFYFFFFLKPLLYIYKH